MNNHDTSTIQQKGRQVSLCEKDEGGSKQYSQGQNCAGEKAQGLTVYIYTLSDPETGEVRYVGKTLDMPHRMRGHLAVRGTAHRNSWIKSLRVRGLMPVMEELERIENSDDTDWQEVERFWIAYFRFLGVRLTNIDSGGLGGKKQAVESIKKRTVSRVGWVPTQAHLERLHDSWRGRKHTDKTKALIGRVHRGKKKSEDHVREMSLSRMGKKLSAETIAKRTEKQRGMKRTPEQCAAIRARMLGSKRSEDAIEKSRLAHIGRRASAETRAKMSAAHFGKKLSLEHRAKLSALKKTPAHLAALRAAWVIRRQKGVVV
jgi:hypothetical protein